MSLSKYSANSLGWQRKPGPLKVWNVVEGKKYTANGKSQQFSIQEIPEGRYEDALNLMCDVFLQDEAVCASFRMYIMSVSKLSYGS